MASDKLASTPANQPLMRDYWRKFRKRTYVIITAAQCSVILVIMLVFQLTGIVHLGVYWFFVIAFIAAALQNIVSITLIHFVGQPFHDIVRAVVMVSGEPSAITPTNPNKYARENDGFKDILQTIYELGTHDDTPPEQVVTPLAASIKEGLDNTSVGIVIIGKDRKIIFHNSHAPIRIDTDENEVLDLLFPEYDTFTDWQDKDVINKLSVEHRWTHVSNKLPGEKDRKIYDIIANYHKNSVAETVVTLVERTSAYAPEEDELDFISFAAHELRGPITVIRGYLDVIRDELGPQMQPDQVELMKRLVVASNRLTSYVNNILNASRYDRRHLKLHPAEESLRGIYDLISDDMQMRASAQNRVLVIDIPENLPTVAADINAIGEVLSNLIDNSIKYSNEGGLVHVMARTIPGFVEISIIDRGIGMPANVLPNLFHKFYRSHRSRETVSGTGIGLYICRAIVSSHGGSITARSVENEGSTFSFTLPIFDTVADKLDTADTTNLALDAKGGGWINNHSLFKG